MNGIIKQMETIADEIDEIRSYIKELEDDKLELYQTYGKVLFSSVYLKQFECCDNYEELLIAYDMFRNIRNKIQELENEIDEKIEQIDTLAEENEIETRKLNRRLSCELIDICNSLSKKGYLVGIKL